MTTPAPARLIHRLRTKVVIAAAAILVLAIGAALRPTPSPRAGSSEPVAPLLEQQVERREPGRLFRGLQEGGRRGLPYAVAFHADVGQGQSRPAPDFANAWVPLDEPSGFGLAVAEDGEVLTHRTALGPRGQASALTTGSLGGTPVVTAYEPETGLTLVRLPGLRLPVPEPAPHPPQPADLVFAAAAAGGRERVFPGFIASVAGDRYLLAASGLPPGTPVYNADGDALGVAGAARSGVVFALLPALERLRRRIVEGRGIPSTLGTVLVPDTGLPEQPGLRVAHLVPDGPAEQAGLRVGDVLVRLAGASLEGLAMAQQVIAALPAGREVEVVVRRAGREETHRLVPQVTLADPAALAAGLPAEASPAATTPRP